MANKIQFFVEISKLDKTQHMVYGYASTEAIDSDGEVITHEAIAGALPGYMKFANIREMHNLSAVGVAKDAKMDDKGLYIGAKIVDPLAWEKVVEGVYKGFSIGGRSTARDPNDINRVTGMELIEISLVDRPANPDALIEVFKAASQKERTLTPEEARKLLVDGIGSLDDATVISEATKMAKAAGIELPFQKADSADEENATNAGEARAKARGHRRQQSAHVVGSSEAMIDGKKATAGSHDRAAAAHGRAAEKYEDAAEMYEGGAGDDGDKCMKEAATLGQAAHDKTNRLNSSIYRAKKAKGKPTADDPDGDGDDDTTTDPEENPDVDEDEHQDPEHPGDTKKKKPPAKKKETKKADDKKPEGDYGPHSEAGYADPGYQGDKKPRYPLMKDGKPSVSRIRAAWSYINHNKDAAAYSAEQVASIKSKIIAAWKSHIDPDGPPSASADATKANTHKEGITVNENNPLASLGAPDASVSVRKGIAALFASAELQGHLNRLGKALKSATLNKADGKSHNPARWGTFITLMTDLNKALFDEEVETLLADETLEDLTSRQIDGFVKANTAVMMGLRLDGERVGNMLIKAIGDKTGEPGADALIQLADGIMEIHPEDYEDADEWGEHGKDAPGDLKADGADDDEDMEPDDDEDDKEPAPKKKTRAKTKKDMDMAAAKKAAAADPAQTLTLKALTRILERLEDGDTRKSRRDPAKPGDRGAPIGPHTRAIGKAEDSSFDEDKNQVDESKLTLAEKKSRALNKAWANPGFLDKGKDQPPARG